MQIFEHTEFTEDNTLRPFNAAQNYIKRASQLKFNCPGKMKYINCDQIAIPDEFEKEKCPPKVYIKVSFLFYLRASLASAAWLADTCLSAVGVLSGSLKSYIAISFVNWTY